MADQLACQGAGLSSGHGRCAGLILGAKLFGLAARGIRVAGVNVCDDRAYFVAAIADEPVAGELMDEEPDAPGCIAGEPEVVEPEPEAAGRSVGAEGAG